MSVSKFSGNPELLPSQSFPARAERGWLRLVGPAGIGLAELRFEPPDEKEDVAEKVVSVGKRAGSLILPRIHF
jgi:hypothetical protein